MQKNLIVVDSVTDLVGNASQCVVVTGSHGGRYPARVALGHGVRAAVFNDAGVGLDRAGVAGLELLADSGIPAVTIDYRSARIGRGSETLAIGTISYANRPAGTWGVSPGMSCADAVALLARAPLGRGGSTATTAGTASRFEIAVPGGSVRLIDSAAMMSTDDDGFIVVTGSHGGMPGGQPGRAARAQPYFVAFNDAGGGLDGAGFSRLPALSAAGIAAVTVHALSARIGDARSAYATGVVSAANEPAAALGAVTGRLLKSILDQIYCKHE